MEPIYELVKNIVIFVFLTAILEQLISESSMQKYIRFFSGIILCILLLQGVLTVFEKQDILQQMKQLSLEYTGEEMEELFMEQEEERQKKITEEYEKQAEQSGQGKEKQEKEKQEQQKIEIPEISIGGEENGE